MGRDVEMLPVPERVRAAVRSRVHQDSGVNPGLARAIQPLDVMAARRIEDRPPEPARIPELALRFLAGGGGAGPCARRPLEPDVTWISTSDDRPERRRTEDEQDGDDEAVSRRYSGHRRNHAKSPPITLPTGRGPHW